MALFEAGEVDARARDDARARRRRPRAQDPGRALLRLGGRSRSSRSRAGAPTRPRRSSAAPRRTPRALGLPAAGGARTAGRGRRSLLAARRAGAARRGVATAAGRAGRRRRRAAARRVRAAAGRPGARARWATATAGDRRPAQRRDRARRLRLAARPRRRRGASCASSAPAPSRAARPRPRTAAWPRSPSREREIAELVTDRTDEPRDRRRALPEREDDRVAPAQHLRQARRVLARPGRARRGARTARRALAARISGPASGHVWPNGWRWNRRRGRSVAACVPCHVPVGHASCSCSRPPACCSRARRRRPPRRATCRSPTRSSARTRSPATPPASGTSAAPARGDPGLRHRHQRQPGRRRSVQGRHAGDGLPPRHLPHGLLRRPGRAQGRDGPAVGDPAADQPACLNDAATGLIDCGNWARLGDVGRAGRRRLGHLLRQARPRGRHRRRQPHRLRRARRRRPLGPAVPDLGHDLAGLQPVRRQQPLHAASPAGPRLQGQLQPAVHDPRHRRRGLGLQRRVPDGPLARSNGYDVSYIAGRRHRPLAGASCSSTRRSCPSATTSTGRARSAPTSRRRATPACTSPSSAATRCSGRPAGRTASTARTPYRTLVTYKETHANAKIDPQPRPGPAPGATRASARRPTAASPRTR